MPRAKLSVSDRIVSDVLSLPLNEATLLVGFLQAALRQRGGQGIGVAPRKPRTPKVPAPASADLPSTMPAESVRKPRITRIPRTPRRPATEVPVGDPGPVEEVGGDDDAPRED